MKGLLLLVIVGVAGYFAYSGWTTEEAPPVEVAALEKPEPVDFKAAGSAYVVIGPDYRGRMRPSVVVGGKSPELSAEGMDIVLDGQL